MFFKLAVLKRNADKCITVIDRYRVAKLLIEIIVCAIAPIPSNMEIKWSYLHDNEKTNQLTDYWIEVPIDVPLTALVILRLYLLGRWAVLHSRLWQGNKQNYHYLP